MEEIDIIDAESRFEQLVYEVEQGQSFIITQQGVAIAELKPIAKTNPPS